VFLTDFRCKKSVRAPAGQKSHSWRLSPLISIRCMGDGNPIGAIREPGVSISRIRDRDGHRKVHRCAGGVADRKIADAGAVSVSVIRAQRAGLS
jgi:hypothetical protein